VGKPNVEPEFTFIAISTNEKIELPREYEDLLIALILDLLRNMAILDAEVVLEDTLDAEYVE